MAVAPELKPMSAPLALCVGGDPDTIPSPNCGRKGKTETDHLSENSEETRGLGGPNLSTEFAV